MKTMFLKVGVFVISIVILLTSCSSFADTTIQNNSDIYIESVDHVPEFSDSAYVVIRNNEPEFDESDLVTKSYEFYSELDFLGRCGTVMACIGVDIMPTEERGSIGQVKPTGWQTVKYDSVDGKYLYNRCHLIGYQLTGENANERNLITGTRYLNIEGMLPFENMIADYVNETENHVIYRVTPVFDGDNLLARGVQMEAFSVEDNGDGICFNVYAYNNQPDIEIDYSNGKSWLAGQKPEDTPQSETVYVLNKSSKKFHKPDCGSVDAIAQRNKETVNTDRQELINSGYSPCKNCNP